MWKFVVFFGQAALIFLLFCAYSKVKDQNRLLKHRERLRVRVTTLNNDGSTSVTEK
jgi:hypothetical protein